MPRLVIANQRVLKCQSDGIMFLDTMKYCTTFLLYPIKNHRDLHTLTHTLPHIHTHVIASYSKTVMSFETLDLEIFV